MRYVVTADEMRAVDAATINEIGLPGVVLMENAGRAVAQVVLEELPEQLVQPRVAVVCGAGNNGGDGFVVARCLRTEGIDATVYLAALESDLRGDARLHFDVYRNVGGPVVSIADTAGLTEMAGAIEAADVVVDSLFGTGLTRQVEGHMARVIETVNRGRGVRVSVDMPSGVSADTGRVLGVAVDAACTVTMAFLKVGLVISPGFAHAGRVLVVGIGIPDALVEAQRTRMALLEASDLAPLVPRPSLLAHKNRRGHLLALAGSPGKRGAARLLTWAAMRAGAGLATLASTWSDGEPVMPDPVMGARLEADDSGAIDRLLMLAQGKQALAMGPGMGRSEGCRALVHAALTEIERPIVLDADALGHLGADLERVAKARGPVVMTPHPGEAARLLGCTPADIQEDRVAAVRRMAALTEAVVVLKGARTLVCDGSDPAQTVTINPSGSAALATAGTGDVLTGIIGALLAQGVPAPGAARLGVYLHGRTGELAADELGLTSATAADLAEHLPAAMNELRAELR